MKPRRCITSFQVESDAERRLLAVVQCGREIPRGFMAPVCCGCLALLSARARANAQGFQKLVAHVARAYAQENRS